MDDLDPRDPLDPLDLETQLRRYADHVEAEVGPVPPLGATQRPTSSRRGWFAAAAAVVVLIAGLVTWSMRDEEADLALGDEEIVVDTLMPAINSQAPIGERRNATIALSDEHVLIWGGFDAEGILYFDGAIYDVAADSWMTLSLPLQGKSTSVAVALPEDDLAVVAQNNEVVLVELDSGLTSRLEDAPFPVEGLLWLSEHLVATNGPELAVLTLDGAGALSWSPVWSAEVVLADAGLDSIARDVAWVADDERVFGALRTAPGIHVVEFDPLTRSGGYAGRGPEWATETSLAATAGGTNLLTSGTGSGPDLSLVDGSGQWSQVTLAGGYSFRGWQSPNDPRSVDDVQITTVGSSAVILAEGRIVVVRPEGNGPPVPIPLAHATIVAAGEGARFATFADPSGSDIGNWLHVEALPEVMPTDLPIMVGSVVINDPGDPQAHGWSVHEWGETLEFSPDGISACTVNMYWGAAASTEELVGVTHAVSDGTVEVICAEMENIDVVWPRLMHVVDGPFVSDAEPLDASDDDPAVIAVPAVTDLFADTAIQTLRNAGFDVATVFEQVPAGSPSVGRIVAQSPAPFEPAAAGTIITITVGESAPEEASSADPFFTRRALAAVDEFYTLLAAGEYELASNQLTSEGPPTLAVAETLGLDFESDREGSWARFADELDDYCRVALCHVPVEFGSYDPVENTLEVSHVTGGNRQDTLMPLFWFEHEMSLLDLPPVGISDDIAMTSSDRLFGEPVSATIVRVDSIEHVFATGSEWTRRRARGIGLGAVDGVLVNRSADDLLLERPGDSNTILVEGGGYVGTSDDLGAVFVTIDGLSVSAHFLDGEAEYTVFELSSELVAGRGEVWVDHLSIESGAVLATVSFPSAGTLREPELFLAVDGADPIEINTRRIIASARLDSSGSRAAALSSPSVHRELSSVLLLDLTARTADGSYPIGAAEGAWDLPAGESFRGQLDFDGRWIVAPLQSGRVFVVDTVGDAARVVDVYAEVWFD